MNCCFPSSRANLKATMSNKTATPRTTCPRSRDEIQTREAGLAGGGRCGGYVQGRAEALGTWSVPSGRSTQLRSPCENSAPCVHAILCSHNAKHQTHSTCQQRHPASCLRDSHSDGGCSKTRESHVCSYFPVDSPQGVVSALHLDFGNLSLGRNRVPSMRAVPLAPLCTVMTM